jgi:phage tail sheath protein FI
VAGRIGGLEYYQSPTFKTISGIASLSRALPQEEQSGLLKANVVPIVNQQGRGVIVLRGLTTDGDQISVRRVADRAVRGTRMLGELFIGRLNNEDGRSALKQKLIEFLAQMQKEGALVPSTDGKDPAFKVNVYSSQADFAQGIVRVDIAVRPVRAIDFIYATIFVQV